MHKGFWGKVKIGLSTLSQKSETVAEFGELIISDAPQTLLLSWKGTHILTLRCRNLQGIYFCLFVVHGTCRHFLVRILYVWLHYILIDAHTFLLQVKSRLKPLQTKTN